MPRRALALFLLAAGLSACASDTFRISPDEQLAAEQNANSQDMASAAAEGLRGTWITSNWRGGICRWSKPDPSVAVCRTATRYGDAEPWHASTQRYRRDDAGGWRLLVR